MKRHILGVVIGTCCVSASIIGLAAPAQHKGDSMGKNMEPLGAPGETPEQTAKAVEASRIRETEIYHLDTVAIEAINADNFPAAEANARQSVSLGLSSGRGLELLAAALDAQGKSQESMQVYKRLYDMGWVFPHVLLPYALLLLKSGQWAQAVAVYNKQLPYSVELMQKFPAFSPAKPDPVSLAAAIHLGLGATASWRGYHGSPKERGQQQFEQFEEALTLLPNSPFTNYYHGIGLKRLGRLAEAKAALQKAAEFGGDDLKVATKNAMHGL